MISVLLCHPVVLTNNAVVSVSSDPEFPTHPYKSISTVRTVHKYYEYYSHRTRGFIITSDMFNIQEDLHKMVYKSSGEYQLRPFT